MAIRLKDAQKAYERAGQTLPHSDSTRPGTQAACLAEINYALHRDPLIPRDSDLTDKEIGEDDQEEQDQRRRESAQRKGIR